MRDEPAILDLLLADLAENASTIAPPAIDRIMSNVELGTRGRGGFAFVIDGENGPVAVALLAPVPWWWSHNIFLQETVLYVAPEARNGRAGLDLLQMEKAIADELSEKYGQRVFLLAGVTGTKRIEAKLRLYGRVMQQIGGFFIHPNIEGLSL